MNSFIERLTLLTGPDLLSPPHGAASSTPTIAFAPQARKARETPAFRFVPNVERFVAGGHATLSLLERPSFKPLPLSGETNALPRVPVRAQSAQELRFDSTLRSPAAPLQSQAVPAPKRD